jgi:hypothetical protein
MCFAPIVGTGIINLEKFDTSLFSRYKFKEFFSANGPVKPMPVVPTTEPAEPTPFLPSDIDEEYQTPCEPNRFPFRALSLSSLYASILVLRVMAPRRENVLKTRASRCKSWKE